MPSKPSSSSTPLYPEAYRIEPGALFGGTVRLPGSKSITNRALLAAALAQGSSFLENALICDDSTYMAEALLKLGVVVARDEHSAHFRVKGAGGPFPVLEAEVFLGNAGTATRFLTAALCLPGGRYVVDGDARMRERPLGDLVRALRELGADIDAPTGCPPVHIGRSATAPSRRGLDGGSATVPGRISSQFISAVLLAAPYARRDVEVLLDGACVSRPYIDVTLHVMRRFGASVRIDEGRSDGRTAFQVWAGRGYRSPVERFGRDRGPPGAPGGRGPAAREGVFRIEGDASTASYFLAAAAITGGSVRVEGIGKESIQGDARFADVLAQMGCHVKKDSDATGLAGGPLKGIDVDCGDMPDIVPTLAAVGLFARGKTRIRNVAHLRFKESDRIASVAAELRRLGGKVRDLPDGLEVEESKLHPAAIDTRGDHRIAMAAAVVGLRVPGVVVRNPGVVAKSYPGFFEALRATGARVTPAGGGDEEERSG